MPMNGTLAINAYTGIARLPLQDVALAITAADGTAIALRLTDREGLIQPIDIPTPDTDAGQTPDTGTTPYTIVNIYARKEGYRQRENTAVQLFPGTQTRLDLELIPFSELPENWDEIHVYPSASQNL